MRLLGEREVSVSDLLLPGDWKQRLTAPHVRGLADSIRERGILQRPKVRWTDKAIVYGRDRLAAWFLAYDMEPAPVIACDCDDLELAEEEAVENAYRRHSQEERDLAIAKLVELNARRIAEERQRRELSEPRGRGRPRSPEGEARKLVAEKLGEDEESIRNSIRRISGSPTEKEDSGSSTENRDSGKPTGNCIETLGIAVPAAVLDEAAKVQKVTDAIEDAVAVLQRLITNLGDEWKRTHLQAIYRHLQDVGAQARQKRPASACPYCRLNLKSRLSCMACAGKGFVSVEVAARAPK